MAVRNSPHKRIPGKPMAGVLRATARAARSTTRRSTSVAGPEGPQGPQGEMGPPGPAATGDTVIAAMNLVCDEQGVATVSIPVTKWPPVVMTTPAGPVPMLAVISNVMSGVIDTQVIVTVYDLTGAPVPGALVSIVAFGELRYPDPAPIDLPEQPTSEGT